MRSCGCITLEVTGGVPLSISFRCLLDALGTILDAQQELARKRRQAFHLVVAPAHIHAVIAVLYVAEVTQPLD